MTPFEISILLHYHTRPGDFRDGDFGSPLCTPTMEEFVSLGLLAHCKGGDQCYTSTEATSVYVAALCSVPAPVQRWVIPVATPASGGPRDG